MGAKRKKTINLQQYPEALPIILEEEGNEVYSSTVHEGLVLRGPSEPAGAHEFVSERK